MKLKKMLLGLTSVGAIVAPVAAVVSCGSKADTATIMVKGATTPSKVYLALDGYNHSATDKSFNQSGYDGVKELLGKYPAVLKPQTEDKSAFQQIYASAAQGSVIVAPGFAHAEPLKASNEEINGKKIILIDESVSKPNVISVTFKVEQAAYLAGYAFAEYASTTAGFAKLDVNHDGKVQASTFGGLDFPTVTGFMEGFKEGFITGLDVATTDTNTYPNAKNVSFFKFKTAAEHFSGGFAAGGGAAISNKLRADGVDVILPVAGGQTKDAIDSGAYVIGVDSAQEKQYSSDKVLFSILKNMKTSIVNALKVIQGETLQTGEATYAFGTTTVGTLDNKLVGISDNTQKITDIYNGLIAKDDVKNQALAATTD